MTHVIVEGTLELEFGDEWDVVLKWDECRWYRDGIHRLGDCKAVDVLAFSSARRQLLMIELEDPVARRKRGKTRLDTMRRALKERLRWLTGRVMFCSRESSDLQEHGIIVRSRPRSGLA